jgi:hypothetical protein
VNSNRISNENTIQKFINKFNLEDHIIKIYSLIIHLYSNDQVLNPSKLLSFNNYTSKYQLKQRLKLFKKFIEIKLFYDHFVIVYQDQSNDLNIALFSTISNSVNFYSHFDRCNFNSIGCSENKIVLCYCSPDLTKCYLSIMNRRLASRINSACLEAYSSVCCDSSQIIGLCGSKRFFDIYDSKLEFLGRIRGQSDCLLPFHFENDVLQIETFQKKIFLRSLKGIQIINERGIQLSFIKTKASQMVPDFNVNKLWLVTSGTENEYELQVYDLNGTLRYKYPMPGYCDNMNYLLFTEKYLIVKDKAEILKYDFDEKFKNRIGILFKICVILIIITFFFFFNFSFKFLFYSPLVSLLLYYFFRFYIHINSNKC